MIRKRKKVFRISLLIILISLSYGLTGCFSFKPTPIRLLDHTQTNYDGNKWVTNINKSDAECTEIPNFKLIKDLLNRAQTKYDKEENIRVTVAVPSKKECKAIFNVNLYGKNIQPVWLKIENLSDQPYWLLSTVIDPGYFSAAESSWKGHYFMSKKANREMDKHFQDNQITPYFPANKSMSGFIYTNIDMGVKELVVQLFGEDDFETNLFFIEVPGLRLDNQEVGIEDINVLNKINGNDLESLRKALEDIPPCASSTRNNRKHQNDADPINFAIIGSVESMMQAFITTGWDRTEVTYKGSVGKMIISSIFGKEYRYAPISPLYMFGRQQDISFQKTRKTINERNHLRIWLTPMSFGEKSVMVGQISRDIGVKLSLKSPTIVTHQIDPDVDETRDYLVEGFLKSQKVAKFGFLKINLKNDVLSSPRTNHLGSPYWTDGKRVVFFMADEEETIDFLDVDLLDWEPPSLR